MGAAFHGWEDQRPGSRPGWGSVEVAERVPTVRGERPQGLAGGDGWDQADERGLTGSGEVEDD
jgi:hypothetical protein